MSNTLNGAVSARLNKCTNQQTSDFVSKFSAENSSLATVIRQLATNDTQEPIDVSDSIITASNQALSILRVVAQCSCRENEYSSKQGFYCDGEDIAQSLDFAVQILALCNDAQAKVNQVLRGE